MTGKLSVADLRAFERDGHYLFHGSSLKIECLEPRQAMNTFGEKTFADGPPAVFASQALDYAMFMALINPENCPKGSRSTCSFENGEHTFGAAQVALDQIGEHTRGYIHVLDRVLFEERSPSEWVSLQKVSVLHTVEISMQDFEPHINLIPYEEFSVQGPQTVSDVIRAFGNFQYAQAFEGFARQGVRVVGYGNDDSLWVGLTDATVLKIITYPLEHDMGTRPFEVPIIERGTRKLDGSELHYYIQPMVAPVTPAQIQPFLATLKEHGYYFAEEGVHQFGYHEGQVLLVDPFAVRRIEAP